MSYSSPWDVTCCLIKRVKIPLLRVIVLSLFLFNFKIYIVTWWACPTSFNPVFRFSCFVFLLSHIWILSSTAIPHPPCRTTLLIIFLSSFHFINIGKSITYQSRILYPRLNHSYLSYTRLQIVRECNIQSCHGWWRHPWLLSYWHPFSSLKKK